MVVKFFKPPKHGGSVGAIRYLLSSKRVRNGTAKILQGDPNITQELILGNPNKQKVDVGCLSFEEPDISEEMKNNIMNEFEEMLMPGMQGRYNILWVQHTDKGRLELNFCIPKIELERKRAITPYLHKADLPRVETWQNLQNLIYNFTDPKDPAKARTAELNSKIKSLNLDYDNLDKILHQKVNDGEIENREQIIKILKDSNIKVTRTGKDYLAIKLPNSKKARRYKGAIYNEQFTSVDFISQELREQQAKINQYSNRDAKAEITKLEEKLSKHIERKRAEIQKRYKYSEPDNQEDEDISLLVINRPRTKFDTILNPIKPDFVTENTRNTNGKDILYPNSKKEYIVKNRDDKVTYIPFYRYEKDIRAKLEPYYNIYKNEWGNIIYSNTKETQKRIKDMGKELKYSGGEIQKQDILAMIDISIAKGWKAEELKLQTEDPRALAIFREEMEKRLIKNQKEMKIKKTKEQVKPNYIEPERIKKEEYYVRRIS